MTQSGLLIRISGALALLALLGACGGSGGNTGVSMGSGGGGATAPETGFSSKLNAQANIVYNAKTAADGARMSAETALEDAREAYDSLAIVSKNLGQSTSDMLSAQAILDAYETVKKAVMDIDAELEKANDARDALMDLDAENDSGQMASKNSELSRIDRFIEQIEESKTEAERIRDLLADESVAYVLGDNEENPMNAADHATRAAELIEGALLSPPEASNLTRELHPDKFSVHDHVFGYGHTRTSEHFTFFDYFGDRVVQVSYNSMLVGAVAIEDGLSNDFDGEFDPATGIGGSPAIPENFDPDTAYEYAYHGMPGWVLCEGTCSASDDVLTGDWYFTAIGELEGELNARGRTLDWFSEESDNGIDIAALTIEYGSWLSGGPANTVLNRVVGPHVGAFSETNFDFSQDNGQDVIAEFSGDATGISVRRVFDQNDATSTVASGHFAADVSLTATFQGAATPGTTPAAAGFLEGTIDEFRGHPDSNPDGVGVDSRWVIKLGRANLMDGGASQLPVSGEILERYEVTADDDNTGWAASPFAKDWRDVPNEPITRRRPEGFFGEFNTHFSNGRAAGVYAVTRD